MKRGSLFILGLILLIILPVGSAFGDERTLKLESRVIESFDAPGDITFELRPVVDGTPVDADASGVTFDAGLHRYRKAFNVQGFTVGYEFLQNANEAGPEIHSAMTFLTAFGSQSTI